MQQLDQQNKSQLEKNIEKVEIERLRQKEALDKAKKDKLTSVLQESLKMKETKHYTLAKADYMRQAAEQEAMD